MQTHVKVLGALYLAVSAAFLLMAFFLIVMGGTAGIVGAAADADDAAIAIPVLGIAGTALAMFLGAFALPGSPPDTGSSSSNRGRGFLESCSLPSISSTSRSGQSSERMDSGTVQQRHGTAVRRCSGRDVNEPLRQRSSRQPHQSTAFASLRACRKVVRVFPCRSRARTHPLPSGRASRSACDSGAPSAVWSGRTMRFPQEILPKLAPPLMRQGRRRRTFQECARWNCGWLVPRPNWICRCTSSTPDCTCRRRPCKKTRRRHVPVERAATEQVHERADRTEGTWRHLPVAFALAFASVAMIAAASLGWHAVLQPATPTPLKASLRGDVTLPADPVIDPELDRSNSGAELPAGADIPAAAAEATPTEVAPAEPSPTSTSGLAAASPSAPLHRTEIVVAGPPAPTGRVQNAPPAPSQARRGDAPTAAPTATAAPPIDTRRTQSTPAPPLTSPMRPDRVSGSEVANAPLSARPAPTTTTSAPASDAGTRPDSAARPARDESLPTVKAPAVEAVPLSASALPSPGLIAVAAPEPAAPIRPRAPEAAAATVDAQAAIRATLGRYEAAYSGLSVPAARAVWPSVDQRALARAFDGLASQRVALGKCDVVVTGASARATCSGSAEWTPKVGGGTKRQSRHWAFDLANSGGTWQIVRAEAR